LRRSRKCSAASATFPLTTFIPLLEGKRNYSHAHFFSLTGQSME
jgi:hypothetical protein